MIRKIITSILFVSFFAIALSALEVDVDEIYKSKKVNFVNYTGKGGKFETVGEIKRIGYDLARKASKGRYNEKFRFHMKYSVVRAESGENTEKYAADIFFIDRDARVDHIKNIRRIISAYLEGTYDYTPSQADALALFVTYYNALHRNDMEYFRSKYQDKVLEYITEKNAGIAVKYSDWPGKTAIVIPLTTESKRGKIDTINPFEISDNKIKEEIKKDSDNNKDREELIKIKENEIEKKKNELEKEKEKTDEEKKENEKKKSEIEKKKSETENKKEEIKKEKENIEKEKEETKKITDPEEKKKKEEEIKKKENELNKQENNIKEEENKNRQEEDKLRKEDEKLKEQEKQNEKKDEELKKKEEETQKEKKELKSDKKENNDTTAKKEDKTDNASSDEIKKKEEQLKEKEKELDKREDKLRNNETDPNVYGLKIYYLEVKDYLEGGHYNNILYMINATTKKIDFKSPVTNICGRRYDIFSEGIVVITHRGSHTMGHRLTIIDRKNLTEVKTGTDDIFWRSFIEIRDGFIYVIVKDKDDYYLGKFDTNLKLVAKSKEKINQNSFITFYEDTIYINRDDMRIIILKKDDLSFIDVIKP